MSKLALIVSVVAASLFATACNGAEPAPEGSQSTASSSSTSGGSSGGMSSGSGGGPGAVSGSKKRRKKSGQTSPGNPGSGSASGNDSISSSPVSDDPITPKQTCNADRVKWAIGRPATDQLLEQLRRESGARIARLLLPDMAVTEEFVYGRLNVYVDRSNAIVRVSCW